MQAEDVLLEEMDTPVDMEPVCVTLDVLASTRESSSSLAAVMRRLVQMARLEGPLRMLGPPTACDLPTFHHHLSALASQLNMMLAALLPRRAALLAALLPRRAAGVAAQGCQQGSPETAQGSPAASRATL